MKNFIFLSFSTFMLLFLSACGPTYFLNEKLEKNPPKVVIILPPDNQTSNTEVEEKLYPILYDILSNRGYYCVSPELARMVFNANKLNEAGRIHEIPPNKFREIFAADAILKTRVTDWSVSYVVISSSITITLEMELFDSKSGELLWSMTRTLQQSSGSSNAGLIGSLINAAISTATFEYEPIAEDNTAFMFKTIPEGPYYDKW
jgi:hypothetical protein